MLVTNTTAHCFVLSSGVIVQPNASNVSVADALYASDSTLNSQLDALEAEGFVTISGKPADSFPPPVQSDADGQVVLTASASDKTPLTIAGAVAQGAPLFIINGENTFEVFPDATVSAKAGSFGNTGDDAVALQLAASIGQSANLFEAYDENGGKVVEVSAKGGVIITQRDVDTPILTLQGMAGAHQDVLIAYDSDENTILEVSADGSNVQIGNTRADQNGVWGVGNDFVGGAWGPTMHNAALAAWTSNALQPGLLVHGYAAQSAELFRVEDSDGNPFFTIHADGTVHIKTGGTVHADL